MFTVTGGTYAYFAFSAKNENTITGTAATTGLNLVVERKLPTNVGVMVPQLESGLGSAISTTYSCVDGNNNTVCQVYKATITNNGTGSVELNGTIKFSGIESMPNLKWKQITDERTIGEYTSNKASTSNVIFDSNKVLTPNASETYYFVIWIDETGTTQTDSGTFRVTIEFNPANGDGLTSTIGVTKVENIVEDLFKKKAISDTSIDFSKTSEESNTNGIYLRSGTENDTYPIYYYRGNVNNNLIFANTCWKIVRTTETGGLKLIYNGLPSNGSCDNTGEASQIGIKEFNTNFSSPAYVGYMYGTPYNVTAIEVNDQTDVYFYGSDVTYSNGMYTLIDSTSLDLGGDWNNVKHESNYRYTCFSTETSCEHIKYMYNLDDSIGYYQVSYITLSNGKKIVDALDEMLGEDDSNTNYNINSSTIKGNNTTEGTLDYWYYTNIYNQGYSSYIEDTVWCNDRNYISSGGFDKNDNLYNSNTLGMEFYGFTFISVAPLSHLNCNRNIDKFTVSEANGNGDLSYPVGLLTLDEINLAGGFNKSNNSYYLYTGHKYWGMTASRFVTNPYYSVLYSGEKVAKPYVTIVGSNGILTADEVYDASGVRPSISLKTGFTLTGDGDGTVTNPYVVE